jgi:hypothetical protein
LTDATVHAAAVADVVDRVLPHLNATAPTD